MKENYFHWYTRITKTDMPASSKLVASVINCYMNPQNQVAWPSLNTLVKETSMTRKTVSKHLNNLEIEGWLRIERGGYVDGKNVSNRYQLLWGRGLSTVPHDTHSPTVGDSFPPNKQMNKQVNKQVIKHTPACVDYPDFELFWKQWPKKTAKAAAEKAWDKLKPDESIFNQILANLECHANAGDWEVTRYIPNPATYLNGKRWEDTVLVQSSNETKAERVNRKANERIMQLQGHL